MKYPQLVSMPSAVSDWLEEQLEARGIDAVVYTRYILSLLHSDTVDVIYSDEDLHLSHLKKEVRRSGGSRKRFRHSSDWWRHAQADAEKLKRSAAVECLMSASEQTCGIESLIDELCSKLSEISKSDVCPDSPAKKSTNPELQHVSPQELAKRYYAAFPPLTRTSSPAKLISLIPKWIGSPKKKPSAPRRHRYLDENMKATSRTVGRQRYGAYFKNNNSYKKDKMEDGWNMAKKLRAEVVPTQVDPDRWGAEDEANMYDDLPVDIKELLDDDDDDETPHDDAVELMNLANMRDTGKRGFIPCGTNIISSIWSNEAAMEEDSSGVCFDAGLDASESVLDIQFGAITINNRSDWPPQTDFSFPDTDTNDFFENGKTNIWDYSISTKWSEDTGCSDDINAINNLTVSLKVLNHNKELSPFAEVAPRQQHPELFNPFSKIVAPRSDAASLIKPITVDLEKETDDLLTSIHSHFRPINKPTGQMQYQGEYADGATFAVSNNWDQINYKRTSSGALYMENDFAMRKKYCEYKSPASVDFVLKYLVCQNDVGCQTDELDAEVEAATLPQRLRDARRDAARQRQRAARLNKCTCQTTAMETAYSPDCPVHQKKIKTPETAMIEEIIYKHQECNKCNNSTIWDTNVLDNFKCGDEDWGGKDIKKIWSGGDICYACLGRPPSTLQHSKLRQDVSQDGDQLLSDLSTIQKNYMEGLPVTELSCDLAEILLPGKERKRRHSLMAQLDDAWSFASRLEEDCLIQMSTLPTLRSVTL